MGSILAGLTFVRMKYLATFFLYFLNMVKDFIKNTNYTSNASVVRDASDLASAPAT